MYDVLPPGGIPEYSDEEKVRDTFPSAHASPQKRVRKRVSHNFSPSSNKRHLTTRGSVVRVQWKLPARLRRPIRQQLAKEKRKLALRRQILSFDRKSIHTQSLLPSKQHGPLRGRKVSLPRHRVFNRGAEHHTGDVYRSGRPQLQVAMPPYVSSFVKSTNSIPSDIPAYHQKPAERKGRTERRMQYGAAHVRGRENVFALQPERDLEFDWAAYQGSSKRSGQAGEVSDLFVRVRSDKKRSWKNHLVLPFVMSVLPYKLAKMLGIEPHVLSRSATWASKKKPKFLAEAINLAILLVGCVLFAGIVWNLQGAGRGMSVLNDLELKTKRAMSEITKAQSAMAESNFDESTQAFIKAQALISDAQAELASALAASRKILEFFDVTGTLKTGQNLLEAAKAMSEAGKHMSLGLAPLAGSTVIDSNHSGVSGITLVNAIAIAKEEFQKAQVNLEEVESSMQNVENPLLPGDLQQQVDAVKRSAPSLRTFIQQVTAGSDSLLYLLGSERDREYLLLFTNNHEIRPIGGFIGTIGLINMDRGRVENIDVQSVYDPDGQLKEFIAPPNPLLPIVDRWFMRDANWFVDWRQSASKIAAFFEKEGGPTVDGVILFTPNVIKRLLDVTGPVRVSTYGETVTSDNVTEIIQKEVTYSYDRELNRPKQFLADLTPILLNSLLNDPASKFASLGVFGEALQTKDMLLFVKEEAIQKKIDELGWSAVFPQDAQGFLHINNANIGGHKSDQFIEQEVDYRTRIDPDGDVEVTVTIRRMHNGPNEKGTGIYPAGDNPALKDNIIYQRVFVPEGAQLIESHGFAVPSDVPKVHIPEIDVPLVGDPDVVAWQQQQRTHPSGTVIGTEAGYTYFANWIITKPGETSMALYRYRLSRYTKTPGIFNTAQRYSIYYDKQPGEARTSLRVAIEVPQGMRFVHTVPGSGLTVQNNNELIYRADVKKDVIVGAVYEKAGE